MVQLLSPRRWRSDEFVAAFHSLEASLWSCKDANGVWPQPQLYQQIHESLFQPFLHSVQDFDKVSVIRDLLDCKNAILRSVHFFKNQQEQQLPMVHAVRTKNNALSEHHDSQTIDHDKLSSTRICSLQLQVILRIILWRWAGDSFVEMYCRKQQRPVKKKNKKTGLSSKKDTSSIKLSDLVINDILILMQLALVKLGTSDQKVMTFLKQCLRKGDCEALPLVTHQIWDYFEKANPYERATQEVDNVFDPVLSLELSPARKKKRILPPSKIESSDISRTTSQAKSKPSLLPTKISLTASVRRKRPNALLQDNNGGGRSVFIGSHFNSSLTNTASLFRQVPSAIHGARSQWNTKSKPSDKLRIQSQKRSVAVHSVTNKENTVPATPLTDCKLNQYNRNNHPPHLPLRVVETPQRNTKSTELRPVGGLSLVMRSRVPHNTTINSDIRSCSGIVAEAMNSLHVQAIQRQRCKQKELALTQRRC